LKNCTQKEEWHSDTVTAVMVPSYIDSSEVVKRGWKRYNLSLGLGLNKVAGKVFRIGHLGNLNEVCKIFVFFHLFQALFEYLPLELHAMSQ
jgi:alanine-glyoxylate transaminase / serine-glyoxylate transaminase / serine-pyruvate transaminase